MIFLLGGHGEVRSAQQHLGAGLPLLLGGRGESPNLGAVVWRQRNASYKLGYGYEGGSQQGCSWNGGNPITLFNNLHLQCLSLGQICVNKHR